MEITARTVAAVELPEDKDDAIFFDDDLAGFGIRLRRGPGGKVKRSYVVQYRYAGRSRRVKIAPVEVITADRARGEARKVLEGVAIGRDVLAEKAARRTRDAYTLRSVVDDYLASKKDSVRARTLYEATRYLTGSHFKPLHSTPIDRISRRDIAVRLMAISREHGTVTAAHARTALSSLFVWSMGMGLCESNPVLGTYKPKDAVRRDRVLSDAELAAVWKSCRENDYGKIVRLLILTAARRQEVGGMRWSEIENGVWTIPVERSKNGLAHTLPLPPPAMQIIERVPQWVGRDWLFGVSGEGYRHWSASKVELDERSGVKGWVIHDLRRTTATRMADLKVPPHVIETVLNHISGHRAGVAGIYNRSTYADEVRAALERWALYVEGLVA